MRLSETRDRFASELTFPVEHETVLDELGDAELDAPYGEPESIGDVLERSDESEYYSADELYDTLVTFVGDAYIGRKFYDDRGSNADIDHDEVSF
ncbi:hypothetical protein BRC86_11625 [Halobacteriales archaeon QS_3_64_16]|nr:MAG: hypothetical protein BRC86_11625 [Halobacteriales archaeon QS_3_64_16]